MPCLRRRHFHVAGHRVVRERRRLVQVDASCPFAIRGGVTRPGQLVRTAEGLTTKVLNERLSKLVRYGVLEKISYPEIPPRVEYHSRRSVHG